MIRLQCVCGHTLNLPDKLAGQKIRCKRCDKVLRVPTDARAPAVTASPILPPSSQDDPSLLIAGSRACPGCGTVYPPTVLVCTDCGLNVETGAMLYQSVDDTGGGAPLPPGIERPAVDLGELAAKEQGFFHWVLWKLGFK